MLQIVSLWNNVLSIKRKSYVISQKKNYDLILKPFFDKIVFGKFRFLKYFLKNCTFDFYLSQLFVLINK